MSDRTTEDEILEIGAASIYWIIRDALRDFDVHEDAIKGCPELAQSAKAEFQALMDRLRAAGMVVVPVEPSGAMARAGGHAMSKIADNPFLELCSVTSYRAMIAAALPAPPATGGEDHE